MKSPLEKLNRTACLSLSGFGCIVASAWHTFGTGAGLLATGVSLLLVEYLSGDSR